MIIKPFSEQLRQQILNPLDAYIAKNPGPYFAAFDADGTLWNSDVGENFFQYQIDLQSLPALHGIDPWDHYLSLKKTHPPDAYLWLAQICAGYPLSTVQSWAQETLQRFPPEILIPQKQLIAELLKRNFEIFIISASTHWAVEAAAGLVDLPATAALGVKTTVINSIISDKQDGFITWREGKRHALLEKTQGRAPLFCSGNSSGDLHLLEAASLVRLAVQTQTADSPHVTLYNDEQKLLSIAKERGWLTHHFF